MSDIVMPRLSDSMTEGTVIRWLKQPGETVARGEPIVEIETDKATITYESDVDGVLTEILVAEGQTVEVGTQIAQIVDVEAQGDLPPVQPPQQTGEYPVPDSQHDGHDSAVDPAFDTQEHDSIAHDDPHGGRVKASPIARRLARKLGIDLEHVIGSGPGGRIVKEDVEAAASAAAAPHSAFPPTQAPAEPYSTGHDGDMFDLPNTEPAPLPLPNEFAGTADSGQVAPQAPPQPGGPGQAPPSAPPPAGQPTPPPHQSPQPVAPYPPQPEYPQPPPGYAPPPQQFVPPQPVQPFPGPPPFVSGMTGGYPAVPRPPAQAPQQSQAPPPQQAQQPPQRAQQPPPQQASAGTATRGQSSASQLTSAQQTVARRMAESKATVPDYFVELDVDMTNAVSYREQLKAGLNPAPSYNDFVVKAAAQALRQYPKVNAAYKDGQFEQYSDINIGVVVSSAELLAVPTIFHADQKGLAQIARESLELANAVRTRTIQPAQLSGGTFSISNLGMYGIDRFTAIINPPQAAILAVGAIARKAVIAEDGMSLVVRQIMTITLTCDHRILYGAEAAEFLGAVKAWLESPQLLPV